MNIFARELNFFLLILSFFYFGGNVACADNIKNGKTVSLVDDNLIFENIFSQASTVEDFLKEQKINVSESDFIFPSKSSRIFSGLQIIINRAKDITVTADGKNIKSNIYGKNVASALWENNIKLGEDDFTRPVLNYPLQSGDKVEVIRVDIREEVVKKDIPFQIKENEDDKLSWRVKKVTQKGERGVKEITYKVVSHNGKEISRKFLREEVIKEPITEIVTQGTYMKLGKAKEGQATWYSFRGGMFAASTILPRGAYAKVTNTENGKSVVVQINDYGPFGKGRIIDLDKPAFSKIASLGDGVVSVKVEQVLN